MRGSKKDDRTNSLCTPKPSRAANKFDMGSQPLENATTDSEYSSSGG